MALDQVFLRQIQRAGWTILAADAGRVLCGCPRDGCDVRLSLRPDGYIPQTSGKGPDYADVTVTNFEDARVFLRRRRESLAYTIREVEGRWNRSGLPREVRERRPVEDPEHHDLYQVGAGPRLRCPCFARKLTQTRSASSPRPATSSSSAAPSSGFTGRGGRHDLSQTVKALARFGQ